MYEWTLMNGVVVEDVQKRWSTSWWVLPNESIVVVEVCDTDNLEPRFSSYNKRPQQKATTMSTKILEELD